MTGALEQQSYEVHCIRTLPRTMLPAIRNPGARVYPKVSGLAAWSENCKWYSSLPLGAVVSLFCESV